MKNKYISKLISTGDTLALLPLRVGLGAILAAHGAQKLFGWFGGYGLAGTGGFFQETLGLSPGVFWAFLAGSGEFFGGLMLLLGALTRVGAALNVVTMAVAIGLVHRSAFFASNGGMEFPLLILLGSMTLLIAGAGGMSIDRALVGATRMERPIAPAPIPVKAGAR